MMELNRSDPMTMVISSVNRSMLNFTCEEPESQFIEIRYYTSGILGFIISILGVLANAAVIFIIHRMINRAANVVLLQALAVCDIFVLVCYIYLYSLQFIFEYNDYGNAYSRWVHFVPYIYPFSRMSQTATLYIMLVATGERTTALIRRQMARQSISVCGSVTLISGSAILSVIFHISRYWEVEVLSQANCTGLAAFRLEQSGLQHNELYKTAYGLWFTSISQVLLPFSTLLVMTVINIVIFQRAVRQDVLRDACVQTADVLRRRQQLRDSTMVLIVLVITYLFFNTLGLTLTIWEFVNGQFLIQRRALYITIVEVINLCAIINSSLRIVNYLIFNRQFREAVKIICFSTKTHVQITADLHKFSKLMQMDANRCTANSQTVSTPNAQAHDVGCPLYSLAGSPPPVCHLNGGPKEVVHKSSNADSQFEPPLVCSNGAEFAGLKMTRSTAALLETSFVDNHHGHLNKKYHTRVLHTPPRLLVHLNDHWLQDQESDLISFDPNGCRWSESWEDSDIVEHMV